MIVAGLRQGARIHVPGRGFVVNGSLDADSSERLRATGAVVVPHVWRDPDPTLQEMAERAAADKVLGRFPDAEGRTRTDKDIAKAMSEVLKPMRKSTHVKELRRW